MTDSDKSGSLTEFVRTNFGPTLGWFNLPSDELVGGGTPNYQFGTAYTLNINDNGRIVSINNPSTITLTLPNNLPPGFICQIEQEGNGNIICTPASGATVGAPAGRIITSQQYSTLFAYVLMNSDGHSAAWRIGGDAVAPIPAVLSAPTNSYSGGTTSTLTVSTDRIGGRLYVIMALSGNVPTGNQIKAGQDATGASAPYASNILVTVAGVQTFNPTGLSAFGAYYVFFMQEQLGGVQSNIVMAPISMPVGAIGEWYASDFNTATGVVLNRRAAVAPTGTMTLVPRRHWNYLYVVQSGTVAMTDLGIAGPDGKLDASTLVASAGAWEVARLVQMPAGQVTISLEVRSNTGSNQNFALGNNIGVVNKVATTSWQRLTVTNTRGAAGTDNIILQNVANAAASLQVRDAYVVPGAVDPGTTEDQGHFYFATDRTNQTHPDYAVGIIDCGKVGGVANLSIGVTTLPWDTAATTFTFMAVVDLPSFGAAFDIVLGDFNNGEDFMIAPSGVSTMPGEIDMRFAQVDGFTLGTVRGNTATNSKGVFPYAGRGFHCISGTCNYDGVSVTSADMFIDDVRIWHGSAPTLSTGSPVPIPFHFSDLLFNEITSPDQTPARSTFRVSAMMAWKRGLSLGEMRIAYQMLKASTNSVSPITPVNKVIFGDNDSITTGNVGLVPAPGCTEGYYARVIENASPRMVGMVVAQGGDLLIGGIYTEQMVINSLPDSRLGRRFIYSMLDGNDIGNGVGGPVGINPINLGPTVFGNYGGDPNAYLAGLAAHLDIMRAAGFYVVLLGILPRTLINLPPSGFSFNHYRNILNATKSTWVGTHCDLYVPLETCSIGADGQELNTANYPDGTHLSDAGAAIVAAFIKPYIDAIPFPP